MFFSFVQNGQTAADIAESMGYDEVRALFRERRSSQVTSASAAVRNA